jgi:hypothetical protein
MQDKYREEAYQSFDNVCGEIPLFENEVRGLDMVKKVTQALFQVSG